LPILQADIRAFGVVGRQDRTHEQKEVTQPARLQGRGDRRVRVAGTEPVVVDVGVGNFLVARGRMRILGDDPVGPFDVRLTQGGQVQLDPELAQEDALQLHRPGHNAQDLLLPVVADPAELLFGLADVLHDVPGLRKPVGSGHLVQQAAGRLQLAGQAAQDPIRSFDQPVCRPRPVPLGAEPQLPVQTPEPLQLDRHVGHLAAGVLQQGQAPPLQALPHQIGNPRQLACRGLRSCIHRVPPPFSEERRGPPSPPVKRGSEARELCRS